MCCVLCDVLCNVRACVRQIPCDDMLFFDDEPGSNMEVTSLGVVFQEIPTFSDTGTTIDLVIQGLEKYQKHKGL